VAVGTTVVRTLESLARLKIKDNKIKLYKTDLFIFPPFQFQMVDILITNFHLPKSSLMMLVEAFLQYKEAKKHLIDLYNIAIKNDFRFYSFGDAMLII
jgi:S-adenosylmethionine--tRNA ribosyltransferase-isomerase